MATKQTPVEGDVEQALPTDILDAVHRLQRRTHDLDLGVNATGQIQSRNYRYLTLDKLHKQVMPLLGELGLVWCCFPTEVDGKPALRYSLAFNRRGEDGQPEKLAGTMLLMLGEKETSQAQGSAITYARRQALACVLGLVPDDDDDGQAATAAVDERLVVSRKLTVDELARTREAFAEAGENFDEALAMVGAKSADEVTLAQGHQLRGILKLKGGPS